VLIPGAHQFITILLKVADYIPDFMRRKPGIDGNGQVMKPKFDFIIAATHMDVRGLVAFVRVEKRRGRDPNAGLSA
jgi:hypothetical protein